MRWHLSGGHDELRKQMIWILRGRIFQEKAVKSARIWEWAGLVSSRKSKMTSEWGEEKKKNAVGEVSRVEGGGADKVRSCLIVPCSHTYGTCPTPHGSISYAESKRPLHVCLSPLTELPASSFVFQLLMESYLQADSFTWVSGANQVSCTKSGCAGMQTHTQNCAS